MIKRSFILAALLVFCAARVVRADEGSFDSNGVKIHYISEGAGPQAVVLIHGWMSDTSMWGRKNAAGKTKLAAPKPEHRVIAIDCRGHGESDKPHDVAQYGPEMGEDVVRLLDHLKIEKAHLVGYSSGSYLAGYVAAKYPERVLSVVYAGQAPLLKADEKTGAGETAAAGGGTKRDGAKPGESSKPSEGAQPGGDAKPGEGATPNIGSKPSDATKPGEGSKSGNGSKRPDAPKPGDGVQADASPKAEETSEVEIFARAVDEGKDLGVYIMAVMPADQPKPTEEGAKAIANFMFKGKDVKALAAAGRGFKYLGVKVEDLKKCEAPTLFIHGGDEGEAVKTHVAAVRERLGRGELKIIEGGNHMTTLMKPEFGATIEEFLLSGKVK